MYELNARNLKSLPQDAALCAELRALTTHSVSIEIAGAPVAVHFNDAEAAALFSRRYRHLSSSAAPRFVVNAIARRSDDAYFWLEGGPLYRWNLGPIKSHVVAFFADAVTTSSVFASIDGLIAMHAAGVSDGRSAAALIGSTTAGKTTTAIACARRGLELYSDEFCIVTPGGVQPFPRSLSLRCAATDVLGADPVPGSSVDAWLRSHGCCDGHDLGYDELFGTVVRPEPRPLRVAFAIVGRSTQPELRPTTARVILEHVGPWAKMKKRGFEGVDALMQMLKSVECYELHLGAPDATARAIAGVLQGISHSEAA
jgi:hypothetical protein